MSSTPIAKMVRELIEKGVDIDVIELAVSTAEQVSRQVEIPRNSADVSAEKRRARDRERKRISKGIPQNSTENPQNSENASLSIENIDQSKKEKRESNRGHRLPENWEPEQADLEAAIALLGHPRADDELAKFRDHWKSQPGSKGVKTDWAATWRNWCRRAHEYAGGKNGNGTGNHRTAGASGSSQSGSDAILAGVAAATERRARERSAAGQQRQASGHGGPTAGTDLELFRTPDGREPH